MNYDNPEEMSELMIDGVFSNPGAAAEAGMPAFYGLASGVLEKLR